ncbi:hypothetical protein VTK26DRAFT_614 [Humicola hyalothermophila]
MSTKPIFVATHPRACSTAFERVFMTRRDTLECIHEPFGDAFYFGPERLGERYANDEEARIKSGFANVTYRDVMDGILRKVQKGEKRLFIKDIAHYFFPPDGKPAEVAPSLVDYIPPTTTTDGAPSGTATSSSSSSAPDSAAILAHHASTNNPTAIPAHLLSRFHFTFLIRHPRRAIPSYYRCTIPPLSHKTGFHSFSPSEAGYDELVRLLDYLLSQRQITHGNDDNNGGGGDGDGAVTLTVVDADDMLDHPREVIAKFCAAVGVEYDEGMLRWGGDGDGGEGDGQRRAEAAFAKWNGFHDDALASDGLRARSGGRKTLTVEEEDEEWRQKYGEEGQRVIRECVNANIPAYEYLKQFALKI